MTALSAPSASAWWEFININYSDSTWQLRNPVSGRCLDAVNGGTANGTGTQLWDCVGGAAQRWKYLASV